MVTAFLKLRPQIIIQVIDYKVSPKTHLIKKILYKGSYSNIIKMTMNKKQLGEEFKSSYCIVTVSCSLSSFFTHDSCNKGDKKFIDK